MQAFYLARTGRPGPVLVDVPKDVQQQLAVPDWDVPMAISGYMTRLPQLPTPAVWRSHSLDSALLPFACLLPCLLLHGLSGFWHADNVSTWPPDQPARAPRMLWCHTAPLTVAKGRK